MMDSLDQRLTDAGTAWRQAQPEPPDLDRLVAGLERRRSRVFSPRLVFVFAAGLILLGAVAAAGVGGIFPPVRTGLPVTPTFSPAPTPGPCGQDTACPSQVPPTPMATSQPSMATSQPSDAARATALLERYEAALVAGKWQTAFDTLAPASPTRDVGIAAYAAERAAYYVSVAGRYTIGAPTQQVPDWTTYTPLIHGADLSRAYLIEVDYPAMSGNNAGYEQFVVAPDSTGTWWIWPVR
jgi:hypothetical protein